MSTFDIRTDAPGLLRVESLGVSIQFDRTSATTGRVSWNIPTPAAGCTADNQAYCGMLVVIDTTPANASKTPVNGVMYTGDPTVDTNLFAGDKIGSAMVVGSFYNDRETTYFDITGLKPNTPYYVTGYPNDCQHRYYVAGVHAYSQNAGTMKDAGTSGTQMVQVNGETGVNATDVTGLVCGLFYQFEAQVGVIPQPQAPYAPGSCIPQPSSYTINIDGCNAATYQELVDEINKQFALANSPQQSPLPPNANGLYWNATTQKLFSWDGHTHTEITNVIIQSADPSAPVLGTYWFDTSTGLLKRWDGSVWTAVTFITSAVDPLLPQCDVTHWFDGTKGYVWNGTTWCEKTVYVNTIDPSLDNVMPCGAYWYDTTNEDMYRWNDKTSLWELTTAIEHDQDPNNLTVGTYWFDESSMMLFAWNGVDWDQQINVSIVETAPTVPAVGKFWYNPITEVLQQWDGSVWNELDVLVFPDDPAPSARPTCDLWWNTATDVLYVWDTVNSEWDAAATFFIQTVDPIAPPELNDGDLWFDPSTNTLYQWENNCFVEVEYISWPTDPTVPGNIPDGTVWYDGEIWKVLVSGTWSTITPTVSSSDPNSLPNGTYWYNSGVLSVWNGITWINVMYSTNPYTPSIGSSWFDISTNTLMVWDGEQWIPGTPIAFVELTCEGQLLFTDTTVGSLSYIAVTDNTLFAALDVIFRIIDSNPGTDGVSEEPSYNELGVGTDGSNDERLKIMNEIRYELGYPVIDVELSQEQLDLSITRALEELRGKTGIAYKTGFFFMRVNSETQRYLLTNKIQGMNKIVNIMGVFRLTSSFLSSAHGAGVYGQIVLQHMYNMGTFDLLSYHIMSEYTELMEILFAGRITFSWDEQKRELWIHHRFPFAERTVLIEASVERTEQDIINDRWCRAWIRRFALATAREMLAETRGKFSTLPGAGGGISLNATDLRSRAIEEKGLLQQELEDYIADRPEDYGLGGQMVIG